MAHAKGFLKGNSNFSEVIIDKIGIAAIATKTDILID